MPACASTRAAPAARRAISTSGRRARRKTSISASNGPARKAWSNGKVGINGISYYAMNQWKVGALKPPHLAALCIWEGSSDYYRELCRHGGILCDFLSSWHPRQVASVQHGVGDARRQKRGHRRAGRRTRDAAERRTREELRRHAGRGQAPPPPRRLLRGAHRRIREDRGAAAVGRQLGRHGAAHARQFRRLSRAPAPSRNGWKCTATRTSRISTASYGEALQKRFFGHFLKGEDTGWSKQPRVVAQHPPSGREIRVARRERMAARAHAMDQIFPAAGRPGLGARSARRPRRRCATRRPATASPSARRR